MTQPFLERIHPYILSNDPHVQNFVLRIIDEGHIGNEETFFLALEANDRKEPKAIFNNIIPRTKNIPIGEKGFKALLERMKKDDANYEWYKARVLQCSAEHFHTFRSDLEEFFSPEMVNVYAKLPDQNEEEMHENLELIAYSLEKEYDNTTFQYGKKVIENMVQRNILSTSEIAETVRNCIQEDEFDFNGLLHLYAAGIANCTELIQDIAPLLHDENDEDYAVELIVEALKRMGTDEVVKHVQPHITKGFHPIGVLEAIKTEKAEEALLYGFDQVSGVMEKTSIAESLCFQLSTKGIPKVEDLIETGYDTQMLLLEEVLYPNLIINKVDHPKLDEWKDLLDKENAPEKEEQMYKDIQAKFEEFKKQKANNQASQPIKSTKVGRNDPCPCASGKKYKKCCGK